jgi:ribose transport system ATP-binding protein
VVAIARALQDHEPGQGCVVFDESSRALPRETLAEFYELIRQLAAEGTSVLIVSHRLDEVLALTHRVTVLRDGRVVGDLMTAQTSERELSRLVLGFDRDRSPLQDAMPTTPQGLVLEVDKVTGRRCRDTSFRVYGGEVVGLIGPTESGYEELPYLISGSAPATGQLVVSGVPSELGPADPLRFLKQEMAFVPSERATEGLALSLSVVENLTLPRVRSRSSRVHLSPRWQKRDYETIAISLGITPRDHNLPTGHLSGGNQQKVLLGKWLLGNPRVLIAHEPTQAVDVGARRDILAALRRAAQMGAGVLISSAEAEDLASTCDRVLVMAEGAVVHELLPPFDADTIIAATYPIVEPEGLAS